jgi:hypothetical protein
MKPVSDAEVPPRFVPVDLTALMDDGVLMAANERFFWPLGLALTWNYGAGVATDLHVRQWEWPDGHTEIIELAPDDPTGPERRKAFRAWLARRIDALPMGEKGQAEGILDATRDP